MKKHKQPEGLKPGIYFDLHEDKYHADFAVSHSGMVDLLVHPRLYWEKGPLNPNREFRESEAMKFGKRCHSLLLEPKTFFDQYAVQGTKSSYDLAKNKKTFLRKDEWKRIKESVDMIKGVPAAYEYFSNGYPEVSIVFVDPATGIRLRIRVDWLRIFGGIDYKRCRDIQNNPLGWAIAEYGYDIQESLYRWGIREIKRMLKAGKAGIFGPHSKEWLNFFMNDPDSDFCFFFQRSTEPFIFAIKEFDKEIQKIAEVRIQDAIGIYKHHIESYGVDKWPAGAPRVEEFSIFHLPRRIFDQGVN